MAWVRIETATPLVEGRLTRFELGEKGIVLLRYQGGLYAYQDRCSHQDVRMSDFGDVKQGKLVCYAHGARFALANGAPIGHPASIPIPCYPVKEEQGELWVNLEEKCQP